MSGLKEKIQDIHFAVFVVRCLRKKRKVARQNFCCNKDAQDTIVEVDDFSGGAHIIDVNMPMRCPKYDSHAACDDLDCPNHNWNNQYIDLLNRFRAAKRTRNHAILNLFKVRHK